MKSTRRIMRAAIVFLLFLTLYGCAGKGERKDCDLQLGCYNEIVFFLLFR